MLFPLASLYAAGTRLRLTHTEAKLSPPVFSFQRVPSNQTLDNTLCPCSQKDAIIASSYLTLLVILNIIEGSLQGVFFFFF